MKGQCYLVGTPIGNLKDITFRAIETLKNVDVIACEDTRHSLILLNHYEIKKPLISYYKQKEKEGTEKIIELLDNGKNVALISDAGMPCISDPGAILVNELNEKGYRVSIIPGPSAVTSAISLCGLEDGKFSFLGFLSDKSKENDNLLKNIKDTKTSLVIYVAPHDIKKVLTYLFARLGERKVYVVKEITKMYEGIVAGKLGQIDIENPKGEYVVVVDKPPEKTMSIDEIDIKEELKTQINIGYTKKEAIKIVCEKYDFNKNQVYPFSIDL